MIWASICAGIWVKIKRTCDVLSLIVEVLGFQEGQAKKPNKNLLFQHYLLLILSRFWNYCLNGPNSQPILSRKPNLKRTKLLIIFPIFDSPFSEIDQLKARNKKNFRSNNSWSSRSLRFWKNFFGLISLAFFQGKVGSFCLYWRLLFNVGGAQKASINATLSEIQRSSWNPWCRFD